jgi:L-asparaginase
MVQNPSINPHDLSGYSYTDSSLPNITIFATGGTIASSSSNLHDTSTYQIGSLGFQKLVDAVPNLTTIANIRGVQVANVGSHDIQAELLVDLAHQIQREVDNGSTQGVVVTHGTDTLEETAFFLDLTIKSDKPVVVVGAMRPATAISADGPMNLLQAVSLAANQGARNRGVMIVMNDRIGSARFTTKTNANRLDAFKAVEQGFLGVFANIQPLFFYPPSRPLGHRHFDISRKPPRTGMPKVDILYGHQELETGLFQSAVNLGAKGLVLAGVGGGWWPTTAMDEISQIAREHAVPLIMSRRPQDGFVGGTGCWPLGCGFLDAARCRIQLQLCLELGFGQEDALENMFYHTGV